MRLGGGKYLFKLKKDEIKKFDLIVVSPKIPIYNKFITYAESIGIKVISELEFGFLMCPYPIIAITGTNGKTTVTKLIEHVLNVSKLKVKALGNIGEPLSNVSNYKNLDYVICEVSSFQLELVYKFKPFIGVITNIESDHLDRHKTLQNYTYLKTSLFKNCNNQCYAVVNNQTEVLNNLTDCLAKKIVLNSDCKVEDKKIFYQNDKLFNVSELNDCTYLSNILAAISVFKILGISNDEILTGINTFKSLNHRLEFVDKIDDVSYYNDSKATNPHATMSALKKLKDSQDIILLLGGQDKGLDFEVLINSLSKNVSKLIAFGEARKKIYKYSKNLFDTSVHANLKSAVYDAFDCSRPNSVVLFSPACASFDEFNNYEERGGLF